MQHYQDLSFLSPLTPSNPHPPKRRRVSPSTGFNVPGMSSFPISPADAQTPSASTVLSNIINYNSSTFRKTTDDSFEASLLAVPYASYSTPSPGVQQPQLNLNPSPFTFSPVSPQIPPPSISPIPSEPEVDLKALQRQALFAPRQPRVHNLEPSTIPGIGRVIMPKDLKYHKGGLKKKTKQRSRKPRSSPSTQSIHDSCSSPSNDDEHRYPDWAVDSFPWSSITAEHEKEVRKREDMKEKCIQRFLDWLDNGEDSDGEDIQAAPYHHDNDCVHDFTLRAITPHA